MILPLETFRGIFALVIVLHHLKIDTFIQKSNFIINGGLVVDFFFCIKWFCNKPKLSRQNKIKK